MIPNGTTASTMASTDPENDDVETDQQKQGTVDVTSDITEAKDLYD